MLKTVVLWIGIIGAAYQGAQGVEDARAKVQLAKREERAE